MANLIQDGRIHPGRIEELVAKVQGEMEEKLLADGEAAARAESFATLLKLYREESEELTPSVAATENPQSIMMQVPSDSIRAELPRLPLPR